jgi:hypothetical protein
MAKIPRKVSRMTASLHFELPEGEEALIQAVQGSNWQQLVADIIDILTHYRDTAKPEHREAYRTAVLFIRDELKDAGLTVLRAEQLKKLRKERQARHAKELGREIKKSLKEDKAIEEAL